jgi:hypothetical protein
MSIVTLSGCQPQIRKETKYIYTPDSLLQHPCKEDYREITSPLVQGEMYVNNTMCLRMYKEQVNKQRTWKQENLKLDNKEK